MTTLSRSLRVDSFEDRVVPSTITLLSRGNSGADYGTYFTSHDRGGFDDRIGLSSKGHAAGHGFVTPQSELFVVTSRFDYPIYIRVITWGGGWNTIVTVTPSPEPARVANVSASEGSSPDGSTSSQVVTSRSSSHASSNNDSSTSRVTASASANISVPVNVPGGPTADATSSTADAAELAAHQVVQTVPPAAFESRPDFGHLSVPIVAEVELFIAPAADNSDVPQSPEPPPAQDDMPVAIPATANVTPPVVSVGDPLPGLFPFNFTAIESGVRGVLDRVANLEHAWSETPASAEDYLWLAAASLVAGGVAQAAWTRRARPTDPRTLGLDSVLTRWGERYVG